MKIDGKNYSFDEPQNNIGINEITRNNKNLKSIFGYFDKNNDNVLSTKEIQNAFNIFKNLDNTAGDADGVITDLEIEQKLRLLPEEAEITVSDYKNFIRSLASTNSGKKLADDLFKQISGISLNNKTLKLLSKIDETNIIEVLREYNKKSPDESLIYAVDNEWGLNIEDVKSKICRPLITRAKALNMQNVTHKQYQEIDDIDKLNDYVNKLVNNIVTTEIMIAKEDSIDPIKRDPQYETILNLVEYQLVKRIPRKTGDFSCKKIADLPQDLHSAYNKKAKEITKMVIEKCRKYDVEKYATVVAQMFGIESGGYNFTPASMNGKIYKGVMQVDLKTCQCIFSEGGKINEAWHKAHFSEDDARIKELKKKYKTAEKLFEAMETDVKLGLEIGIIALKAKIHEAGSIQGGVSKYCGNNYECDYSKIPDNNEKFKDIQHLEFTDLSQLD